MYSIYDTLILLVDNDVAFLNHVKGLLVDSGFQQVLTAHTCKEAIALCDESDPPYLIVMEYHFRSMTGPQLIEEVKNKCKSARFIVLSDSAKLADSFKSYEAGALSFIHKNDKNWQLSMLDSVRTWMGYYKQLETRRVTFREKLNQLQVTG